MAITRSPVSASRAQLLRDHPVGDVGIGAAAGFYRAEAVRPRPQRHGEALARMRSDFRLEFDVRGGALPEQAQLALRQRPS
jgi:hypothetical protein